MSHRALQILSAEDMSKIPRLPGDGAQANSELNFDESSPATVPQPSKSSRPSAQTLRESFLLESERHEGKLKDLG